MSLLDFVIIVVVLLLARFVPAVGANVILVVFFALIAERVLKGEKL